MEAALCWRSMDFPMHLFEEGSETTELKSIHNLAAIGLQEIHAALKGLAEKADQLKKQRNRAIESSKWAVRYAGSF